MEKLGQLLFVLGPAMWIGWAPARRFLKPEFKTNEQQEPPSDAELK